MVTLSKLTDKQFDRFAARMAKKLRKATNNPADGYQPFGWDWRTFRICHKVLAGKIERVRGENKRRKAVA